MAFWSDTTLPEPHRQYRWYLDLVQQGISDFRYALKTCKKPQFSINTTEHTILNKVHYYPGILKWEPIDVTMASVSKNDFASVANVFQNYIIKSSGYDADTYVGGISKKDSVKQISESGLNLYQIDENGKIIENWSLTNPFITKINYGNLDYGNEEIVEISFTIVYDHATLKSEA